MNYDISKNSKSFLGLKGGLWSFFVNKGSYFYVQCFSLKCTVCIIEADKNMTNSFLKKYLQSQRFEYLDIGIASIHVYYFFLSFADVLLSFYHYQLLID